VRAGLVSAEAAISTDAANGPPYAWFATVLMSARPGTHQRFVAPLWKQSLGSTIHCVAGDHDRRRGRGDPHACHQAADWGGTIVAGFGFGLLVFQAPFMRDTLGRRYLAAVKSTVPPD
jgi:hypothetical protein